MSWKNKDIFEIIIEIIATIVFDSITTDEKRMKEEDLYALGHKRFMKFLDEGIMFHKLYEMVITPVLCNIPDFLEEFNEYTLKEFITRVGEKIEAGKFKDSISFAQLDPNSKEFRARSIAYRLEI